MEAEGQVLAGRMLALLRCIPPGSVATYGQIAQLAGAPRHARMVGRLLGRLPSGSGVPWHRVVNAQGKISPRSDETGQDHFSRQARLLRKEGVTFINGRIPLRQYQWEPVPDENWPLMDSPLPLEGES